MKKTLVLATLSAFLFLSCSEKDYLFSFQDYRIDHNEISNLQDFLPTGVIITGEAGFLWWKGMYEGKEVLIHLSNPSANYYAVNMIFVP